VPASLFVKWIWNGWPAGAVSAAVSYATFCALIWRTVPPVAPLAAADAGAEAGADAGALPAGELDAASDAPGDAEPAELGAGVTDGAGAYVQPGVVAVHATTARAAVKAAR